MLFKIMQQYAYFLAISIINEMLFCDLWAWTNKCGKFRAIKNQYIYYEKKQPSQTPNKGIV